MIRVWLQDKEKDSKIQKLGTYLWFQIDNKVRKKLHGWNIAFQEISPSHEFDREQIAFRTASKLLM